MHTYIQYMNMIMHAQPPPFKSRSNITIIKKVQLKVLSFIDSYHQAKKAKKAKKALNLNSNETAMVHAYLDYCEKGFS